jgi:septum site-determining protein MinD
MHLPVGLNEENFGALLKTARAMYDYILIDSPAGLGAGFQLAIAQADRVLVVATNDATSLRDAQRVVTELSHIKRVHLIMNRIQPQLLRRLRTTIDDAMNAAGLPLLGVVPEDVEVMLCANRGLPLTTRGRKGAGQACWNIAQRLDGLNVPIMRIRKQGLF